MKEGCMWSLSVKFVCEGTIFESLFRTKMIRVTCENFVWWNSILTSSCLLFCLFMPFIFNFSILSFFIIIISYSFFFLYIAEYSPTSSRKIFAKLHPKKNKKITTFHPTAHRHRPRKKKFQRKCWHCKNEWANSKIRSHRIMHLPRRLVLNCL